MKKLKRFFYLFLISTIFIGCSLIGDIKDYEANTQGFIEALIDEEYDRSRSYLVKEEFDKNSVQPELEQFRETVVNSFGNSVNYSFVKSQKRRSTIDRENTPEGKTEVFMKINGSGKSGVLEILFHDNDKKISYINITNIKIETKPSVNTVIYYWLYAGLGILIVIFNIYVIIQIKRSYLNKKWIKYITVFLLNVPSFTYSVVNGFSFKLLSIQLLCGIGFSLNNYFAIGLPLGGLYWFCKLRQSKLECKQYKIEKD